MHKGAYLQLSIMHFLSQVLREQPQALQSLTGLGLHYNQIGDEGLGHLSQALQEQPQALQALTKLHIDRNLISGYGKVQISQALREQPEALKSLITLIIGYSSYTREVLTQSDLLKE